MAPARGRHVPRSWEGAPPGSWGRPIGAMKSRLIAGDLRVLAGTRGGRSTRARERSESPIGRYAAALALLVLGEDARAADIAATLRGRDDFPSAVADSLVALAAGDAGAYEGSIRALLADFESRDEFLEDMPVADTVLALQALASRRGLTASLRSPLLPA